MTLSNFPKLYHLLKDLNIILREQEDVRHHLIDLLTKIESLDVDENDSDINRIVDLIDVLEHRTRLPETMFRAIRECVSQIKKGRNELSTRQYVLQALDSINYPQPAARIKQFVWANERVELNTRTFGALRRDEKLSWANKPFHRSAYIVPVIDVQGDAQSQWLARSDWPLWRRIVVEGATEIFDLKWIELLLDASEAWPDTEFLDPYVSLIPKFTADIPGIDPPPQGYLGLEGLSWDTAENRSGLMRLQSRGIQDVGLKWIAWLHNVKDFVAFKLDSSESRVIVSQREAEDDFKLEDAMSNNPNKDSRLWGN
jgi:hypothetical protein